MMVWLTFLVATATAQQPAPAEKPSVFGARYDGFRWLFANRDLTPASARDFLFADRESWKDWIVVVLDDTRPVADMEVPWDQFVRAGGALLIATDRDFNGAELMLRTSIDPGPVTVDAANGYLGRSNCPLITKWEDPLGLFDGVKKIAANRSGYFSSLFSGWDTKAYHPATAQVPGGLFSRQRPFFAARNWDKGRFAIAADQSLFSNEMLLEVDNCRFAANCVQWLSDNGRRKNVLFIEAGNVVDDWVDPRFEAGRWPQSDWDSLVALINEEIVPNLNRSDVINGLIHDLQSSIDPRFVSRLLGLGSGLLILLVLTRWILKSRATDRTPKLSVRAGLSSAVGDAFAMRSAHRRERDDYSDAAQRLANMALEKLLGPDWRTERAKGKIPGNWFARRRFRHKVAHLKQVALRGSRKRLDRAGFEKFYADIQPLAGLPELN